MNNRQKKEVARVDFRTRRARKASKETKVSVMMIMIMMVAVVVRLFVGMTRDRANDRLTRNQHHFGRKSEQTSYRKRASDARDDEVENGQQAALVDCR